MSTQVSLGLRQHQPSSGLLRALACAALLLSGPTMARAQLDKAWTNYQNVKRLATIVVDAADKNDRDTAYNACKEMRENFDYLEKAINDTKDNLHEDDQEWYDERKEQMIPSINKMRVAAGTLQASLGQVGSSYSSYLSNFKSQFNDFHEDFEKFIDDLRTRRHSLEDRLEKWRDVGIRG